MQLSSFKPSEAMTFKTVPADLERFTRYLEVLKQDDAAKDVSIDLSQVCRCDSAGLAFLIEAKKQSQQQQKVCHFLGMPSVMEALVAFWGIEEVLRTTLREVNARKLTRHPRRN